MINGNNYYKFGVLCLVLRIARIRGIVIEIVMNIRYHMDCSELGSYRNFMDGPDG